MTRCCRPCRLLAWSERHPTVDALLGGALLVALVGVVWAIALMVAPA